MNNEELNKQNEENKENNDKDIEKDKVEKKDEKGKEPKKQKMMPVTVCSALLIITFIITFIASSAFYNNRRYADIADAVQKEKDYYSSELNKYKSAVEDYKDLVDADAIVKSKYIGAFPDNSVLTENILYAYFSALGDPYGYYYSPEYYKQYNESRSGTGYGIGIVAVRLYDAEFGGIYISDVIDDSPAESAGLKPGDVIVAIDGSAITPENVGEQFDSIRGESGSEIVLRIKSKEDGSEKDVSIIRGEYKSRTAFYKEYDSETAYIRISNFYDNTDEEFKEIIDKCREKGTSKYIFDLRNNPGGALDTVLNMLDYILPKGPLIRIVDKDGNETVKNSENDNSLGGTAVVLVNDSTASAAELFSAALKDYNAASLVGVKTYGKGSMQSIYKLDSGAAVKITDHKYLPPYSEGYDGVGLTPDILIDLSDEQKAIVYKLSVYDDLQVKAAFDFLNNK